MVILLLTQLVTNSDLQMDSKFISKVDWFQTQNLLLGRRNSTAPYLRYNNANYNFYDVKNVPIICVSLIQSTAAKVEVYRYNLRNIKPYPRYGYDDEWDEEIIKYKTEFYLLIMDALGSPIHNTL